MDTKTFEQEEVSVELFGSAAAFLVPDITVTLNFAPDGKAVSGVLSRHPCCNAHPTMPGQHMILRFQVLQSELSISSCQCLLCHHMPALVHTCRADCSNYDHDMTGRPEQGLCALFI